MPPFILSALKAAIPAVIGGLSGSASSGGGQGSTRFVTKQIDSPYAGMQNDLMTRLRQLLIPGGGAGPWPTPPGMMQFGMMQPPGDKGVPATRTSGFWSSTGGWVPGSEGLTFEQERDRQAQAGYVPGQTGGVPPSGPTLTAAAPTGPSYGTYQDFLAKAQAAYGAPRDANVFMPGLRTAYGAPTLGAAPTIGGVGANIY